MQRDIVCIDGVSGFLTVFGEKNEIDFKNGSISGSSFIKGGNFDEIKNFLVPVNFEDETRYILISKNLAGIKINEESDDWGNVVVEFTDVAIENDSILPDKSEAGDKISNFEIRYWLEDTFLVLSSASVLG